MHDYFSQVLNLARRTGDRLVVFDSAKNEEALVVMSFEEYEKLLRRKSATGGLTEGGLLDKINRDIADWKADREMGYFESDCKEDDLDPYDLEEDDEDGMDDSPFFQENHRPEENIPYAETAKIGADERRKRPDWSIPGKRKQAAEEVVEEDLHYLEDIRF